MRRYLLVAGSRDFTDTETFDDVMEYETDGVTADLVIVEGGAKGVDTMAKEWARENGAEYVEIKPEWGKYGKAAGPKRNDKMVELVREKGGKALYFWNGESKGTRQCIESARKAGVPVKIWDTVNGDYME